MPCILVLGWRRQWEMARLTRKWNREANPALSQCKRKPQHLKMLGAHPVWIKSCIINQPGGKFCFVDRIIEIKQQICFDRVNCESLSNINKAKGIFRSIRLMITKIDEARTFQWKYVRTHFVNKKSQLLYETPIFQILRGKGFMI